MTQPKERLIVLNVHLAFAVADEDVTAVYDLANCALIPLQRHEGGNTGLVDYAFRGEPIVSPSPVQGYDYENGFELPQWEVQTLIGDSWENTWTLDEQPMTFPSEQAAKAAIFDFLSDVLASGMEPYDIDDYRVRPVEA